MILPDLVESSSAERLTGSVERVTYHNEDNGFCVLRVKVRGRRELVTVVATVASIAPGEYLEGQGQWINDRSHGLQFRAEHLTPWGPLKELIGNIKVTSDALSCSSTRERAPMPSPLLQLNGKNGTLNGNNGNINRNNDIGHWCIHSQMRLSQHWEITKHNKTNY